MAQTSISVLKQKFSDGKTPNGNDFSDIFDSYWHRSIKLPQSQILGLNDALDEKANKEDVEISLLFNPDVATKADLYTTYPNPVNGDASLVEDEGYIYQYRTDKEDWVKTPFTAWGSNIVTKDDLLKAETALKHKFLPDRSYSGYVNIDYNHLVSIASGGAFVGYNKSENYDAAWVQIFKDSGTLEISGCVVRLIAFFNTLEPTAESFISFSSSSFAIPEGAKLCIVDLEKANNPEGYLNMRVRQIASGVDRNELDDVKQALEENIERIIGNFFSIKGYAVREAGNITSTVTGIDATDFLPITGLSPVRVEGGWRNVDSGITPIAFYDERKKFIDCYMGVVNSDGVYEYAASDIPVGSKFIRCCANVLRWPNPIIYGVDLAAIVTMAATKKEFEELSIKTGSFSSELFIEPNHLVNIGSGGEFGGYISSQNYDAAWFYIYSKATNIELIGALGTLVAWFNDTLPSADTYISQTSMASGKATIPAGAVMGIIDLAKVNNTTGYKNLRVTQGDFGAFRKEDVNPLLESLGLIEYKDGDVIEGVQVDGYQRSNGTILISSDYVHNNYVVSDAKQYHLKVTRFPQSSPIRVVQCFNSSDVVIGSLVPMDTPGTAVDTILTLPFGTVKIAVNWRSNSAPAPILNVAIPAKMNIKDELDTKEDKKTSGIMKVHVYGTETALGNDLFYIRTPYNKAKTKDILLVYYTNNNGLISPKAAYVGDPLLSDIELMTSTYLVSSHSDSTAPLFNSSVYWHLFAQHGYVIPRISNTVNMTSADVGAVWKDQLNREYTIGDVTSTVIQLLPVIIRGEEGKDTRGWKTPNDTAIATLYHVSGGVITDTFQTNNLSTTQLRPIMKSYNRKFYVDGQEITASGDYYCNDFNASESQIGYDPAYIENWYPLPDLTNVPEMARFTWSYNFKGANCCVNTTIDIRRKAECQSYGATQQQTFLDKGDYKAMFMIPKAAPRNGKELDKPFNSPATSSPAYGFFRTPTYLKDVNKPIDRLIAFLQNPNDGTFLVGMAAGLSLVSGDTTTEKRNANIPIGDTDSHYRLGSLSPGNTNKFYVAAVNTSPFADDGYNFPNTYFKEINYYVCFFDPADNVGQVYWYKDGNSYVIYAHCQSAQNRMALVLPDFMEGLSVEVVEQTDATVLLTSKIQNGNLFVNYNTDDANYIVLKTN